MRPRTTGIAVVAVGALLVVARTFVENETARLVVVFLGALIAAVGAVVVLRVNRSE